MGGGRRERSSRRKGGKVRYLGVVKFLMLRLIRRVLKILPFSNYSKNRRPQISVKKRERLTETEIMATSAQTLSTILDTLAQEFKFDKADALKLLAHEELLPKKLMPSPAAPAKKASPWGSKKAEEVAAEHGITPNGPGSGKDGKWILSDVKKLLDAPVKAKINASPAAVKLALENKIDLSGVVGSGKDDKILVKDVKDLLAESEDEEESDEEN